MASPMISSTFMRTRRSKHKNIIFEAVLGISILLLSVM